MPSQNKVLFLCTGNSARSILAEAILKPSRRANLPRLQRRQPPTGRVNPYALEQLEAAGLPTAGLRSESWEEFAKPGSAIMNFVFTVCDNAAKEICPIWPGQPVTAHWGVSDPVTVVGSPACNERPIHSSKAQTRFSLRLSAEKQEPRRSLRESHFTINAIHFSLYCQLAEAGGRQAEE